MEERIITLYGQGYTQKQICEMLGLQFYRVNKCLREHNVKTGQTKRTPDEIRNLVVILVRQGIPQADIADMLDISIHNVRDITYQNGLSWTAIEKRKSADRSVIVDMYRDRHTISTISKELHADKKRIKETLIAAGVYESQADKDEEIRLRLQSGETMAAIAKECGTSYRRIKRLCLQWPERSWS